MILCLDFDGVIHSYVTKFSSAEIIPDPPVEGAIQMLWQYIQHFNVQIFSTRSAHPEGIKAMKSWLYKWNNKTQSEQLINGQDILEFISFPTSKPPAFLTIDDRALQFTGVFPSVEQIKMFKPWNK